MVTRRDITQTIIDLLPTDQKVSVDEAFRSWYQNIRDNGGLRLTTYGYQILQNLNLENWLINVPDIKKCTQLPVLLDLDRKMKYPYYIDYRKKCIVMFSSKEAMLTTLYGDLQNFLKNYG